MSLNEQSHLLRGIFQSPHPLEDLIPNSQKPYLLYLLHYYEEIPESKKKVIEKIIKKLEKITQNLLPLYKLGFEMSVSVIGGSIRDILLNKENDIADIDILISIEKLKVEKTFETCPYVKYKEILGPEILNYLNLGESSNIKFASLVKYCLEKDNVINEYTVLASKEPSRYGSRDINEHLQCLMKIKKESEDDYPMDIMISHASAQQYVERTVDFNICKAYLKFIDMKKLSSIPIDSYSFFDNVVVGRDFLTDAQKKEITLDMSRFNENQITFFMDNHYPKIEKKYNDYNLNLLAGSRASLLELKAVYEKKARLDKTLDIKDKSGSKYKL